MTRRILLDVDGVLADFVTPAAKWARRNGHRNAYHDNCTKWDVLESWGLQAFQPQFDQFCSRKGFCKSLPVYPGAVEFVEQLRRLGEVIVVTSPLSCSPYWCHERTIWLAEHFGFRSKDVIFAKRKELVCGDVLIDDGPHNLETFANFRLLLDRPWNRESTPPRTLRRRNYQEILDFVPGV